MAFTIAMLQTAAPADNRLLIILGVITLFTFVALGLRFLVNMKEVLTAPTACLKHHGQNDNFFFSLVVVFLGGLLGTFALLLKQSEMVSGFHTYAQTIAQLMASGNASQIYRSVAEQYAVGKIDAAFNIYFINNLIFFPLLVLALWFVIGTITYGGARMFGGQSAFGSFMGSLAYPFFFGGIAWGFFAASAFSGFDGWAGLLNGSSSPTIDAFAIIGIILCLYSLILFIIAVIQAADLVAGQLVGAMIVLLVVLGGGITGGYYSLKPKMEAFNKQIQEIDPSQPGFQFPK